MELGNRSSTLLRYDSHATAALSQHVNNNTSHVGFRNTQQQICNPSITTLLNQILVHPMSPTPIIRWVDNNTEPLFEISYVQNLELMNRNARPGKRANRGKRPVSRHRRRNKKRAFGNHRR